jgi:hypothetical protein
LVMGITILPTCFGMNLSSGLSDQDPYFFYAVSVVNGFGVLAAVARQHFVWGYRSRCVVLPNPPMLLGTEFGSWAQPSCRPFLA